MRGGVPALREEHGAEGGNAGSCGDPRGGTGIFTGFSGSEA